LLELAEKTLLEGEFEGALLKILGLVVLRLLLKMLPRGPAALLTFLLLEKGLVLLLLF